MRSRAIVTLVAVGGALVTGGWLLQRGLQRSDGTVARARLFDAVLDHVARDYVDSIPASELYKKAAMGMVDGLHDPYSAYLTPNRLDQLDESTSGTYAGVGVQIDLRDGWLTIISPLPGTPAQRAGIQPGDRIVAVGDRSTEGWTIDEARNALRGPKGSSVSLLIERPGVAERIPFSLVRSDIHVRSVRHPMMLTSTVGYVDLTIFSDSSDEELRDAIADLRRHGMNTLIFDLRANPGGLLEQGAGVADLFLDPGEKIVTMRGRASAATREFVDHTRQLWPDLLLITLVDGHSASAAEIVAGALQDHDRSVIVGSTTYGKGSAQAVFPLGDHAGALKLTTARWFTPSGRSIQKPLADTIADDDLQGPIDSTATKPKAARKPYHTDDGRVVYGGGGITPDLEVASEDSADGMLAFWRLLGPDIPRFRDALTEYALDLKTSKRITSPTFAVTPAMRDAFWHRLQAKGIALDRSQYDAATKPVDELIAREVTRYVFGATAAYRRDLLDDRVVTAALDLAAHAHTEHDLLARAAALQAAKPENTTHAGS